MILSPEQIFGYIAVFDDKALLPDVMLYSNDIELQG